MFPRPLPLLYDTQRETKISLIKATSKKDLSLNWISKQPYSQQNLLVLFKNTNETEKININQQIYILNFGLQLFEKYVINNQVIERKLGHFVGESYVPEELIEESFLKRRMNFNGSTIIALTEKEQTTIILENLDKAPFFLSNQTYDVTNFVSGSFYDIWKRIVKMTYQCMSELLFEQFQLTQHKRSKDLENHKRRLNVFQIQKGFFQKLSELKFVQNEIENWYRKVKKII